MISKQPRRNRRLEIGQVPTTAQPRRVSGVESGKHTFSASLPRRREKSEGGEVLGRTQTRGAERYKGGEFPSSAQLRSAGEVEIPSGAEPPRTGGKIPAGTEPGEQERQLALAVRLRQLAQPFGLVVLQPFSQVLTKSLRIYYLRHNTFQKRRNKTNLLSLHNTLRKRRNKTNVINYYQPCHSIFPKHTVPVTYIN
jgi:hypothetical protein